MQSVKAEFLDAGAVSSRSRSPSVVSTDSQFSRVNLMSPPSVTPAPGFISSSAATDIISADQEFNAADFVAEDESGSGAALVTPAALSLLNAFLDNLLFNILASSKSTQLACIRPAMAEVLKPRLAKEVVAAAEEELSEYMGGAEDEQTEFRGGQEPGGDFDLVHSWKLTRLRCMVYTRLGDMEEDDEDEFIAQDGLGETDGAPRRFTSHVDNITPAASIFLTSIIEFIGERALVIAGETARSRLLSKLNDGDELNEAGDERRRIDRLVVEDLDMEKLALNPTLGRLWRTWRKRRRGTTLTRTMSRESFSRRGYSGVSRKSSIATIEEPMTPAEPLPESPPLDPASVPLPISEYDVQEIEVPGYTGDLEGEVQTMQAVVAHKVRPRSLMVFSSPSLAPRSPGGDNSPVSASAIDPPKLVRHVRSRSLPTAASNTPAETEVEATPDQPSPTPSEKKKLETMYEDDESAEFVDAAETAPGVAITTPHETSQLPEHAAEDSDKAKMSVLHEEEEEAPLAVNEMVASLRTGNDEDLTDQSNSARVSVASLGDRPGQKDPEVIEGTGLCEKPKWTPSINRPKRKSSRDVSLLNARSISAQTSGPEMQAVAENQPPKQGVEATQPEPPKTPVEAIDSPTDQDATDGDQNKRVMPSTLPTRNSDGVEVEKFQAFLSSPDNSRPTSADSERSQSSKPRPRPAPLLVKSGNRSPTASERATVQRMTNRPATSVSSSIQTKTRRSSSFGSARETKRPVTAGSTTSQVSTKLKGLMGRPQGDSPSLRLRSSSETSRASGGSGDSENEIADLDKLINSDETIHFTLTPRSVREMTFPDSPNRPIPRSDTADTSDLADFLKTTSPPGEEKHRSRASVSSKATGEMIPISRTRSIESPKHIPLSTRLTNRPAKPSKTSQSTQARDALAAPADATRDFADFIKAPGASSTTSAPAQPKTSTSIERPQPVRPPSSLSTTSRGSRPRLEARSADTSSSQTSELIDFIREGPPPMPGAHRIPRTVAPFRNTIDSDDLQIDNTPENTTSGSVASTGDGSTPNKSLTSLGSRTALLDSTRNKASASGSATAFEDPAPQRKQRRVRDPYAIDDDDDDEYLEELLELENKPKPKREEESLMDFLRSAPPPPPESGKPPVPFTVNTAAANGRVKSGMVRSSQSSLRSQGSVPGKVQNNYATKVGMERNNGSIPSASNRKTETGDLADFLRNTGPPEPAARAISSPNTSKMSSGGFSRFFTRRKKVES